MKGERGQAFVVSVLFLVVLLGMAGLAIDLGAWYVKRQDAQAAADFGALAAAAELPGNASAASAAGTAVAKANLAGASAAVTSGFGGVANKAEVEVTVQAPVYFTRLFGLDDVTVNARAVAQRTPGQSPQAIHVHDTTCGSIGLKFNGDGMNIEGDMHSNGTFEINGKNNRATSASAGGPNRCPIKVDGENISFGGNPRPTVETAARPWPAWFTTADFTCTRTATKFTFNTHGQTIPSGVYCADTFEANGDHQRGTITVLAKEIKVNGNYQNFKPYAKDVLFFATGTKDLDLSLNGYRYDWTGIIFHPLGKVKINGDSASVLRGLIEAQQVEINGAGFRMIGTGGSSVDEISLVE